MISRRWNGQRQTKTPLLILLLLGSVFALLGGIFTAIDVSQMLRVRGMQQHWLQTQAVMDQVQMAKIRGSQGVLYQPEVTYHYWVAGREYQGVSLEPFSNNESTSNFGSVQQKLRPYQVGHKVAVYYDPANPSDSALSLSRKPSLFLWIGVPFFLIGLGFLAGAWLWFVRVRQ